MQEKVKITKKELDEIYELVPDIEDTKQEEDKEPVESLEHTFEEIISYGDKKLEKELKEEFGS